MMFFLEAKKIRDVVFVKEQECPINEEFDKYDNVSYHIVGFLNKKPVCCAKILKKKDEKWYLGRIAVLKENRDQNLVFDLMKYLIEFFIKNINQKELYLNAQIYALNFYKKLNFNEIGETFFEANIEHIKMVRFF
ncbi:GNAT family N-acetyltransferase [Spiroplasma taiwanense]|uniref:Acetyltransferase, GNAT family protein n=1 Tax=Spiroplasma taiwanense CT-1 TaxID=1276220 RepID=S5LT61_9MOLU|nr:GNAT family N-acetyltransferase [Spiroplasma taiwanense]AGR40879.1 acetyltransferase, GNAT family protein [Spiroplasma taiwanense CT-1]